MISPRCLPLAWRVCAAGVFVLAQAGHGAHAVPDGHTLMIMSPSTTVMPTVLYRTWALDSRRDFTQITAAADFNKIFLDAFTVYERVIREAAITPE